MPCSKIVARNIIVSSVSNVVLRLFLENGGCKMVTIILGPVLYFLANLTL